MIMMLMRMQLELDELIIYRYNLTILFRTDPLIANA